MFLSAKAAAEEMIRTKSEGSIILIASMSASVANRDLDCVAYNASKAGVLQMGRNLACEWGKYKIRVNVRTPAVQLPARGRGSCVSTFCWSGKLIE